MKASFSSKAKVGFLITAAFAVVAFTVVSVGTRQKIFSRSVSYHAQFRSVAGLQHGSPVQLHGVRIGTVQSVELLPDAKEPKIRVGISVEKRYAPHIRSDIRAQIKTLGVLGDKYIFLSSERDPNASVVAPGGVIQTVEIVDYDELIRQSEDILTNAAIITSSLRQLLLGIQRGDSLIGKLVSDPDYGLDTFAALTKTLQNAESITGGVRQGKGLAGRIFTDEEYGARVAEDVRTMLERVNAMLAATERGENVAGKMLGRSEEGKAFFENLRAFSHALREIGEAFEKDEGFLPALFSSSPESRDMVSNFHTSLHRLASILDKLDRGEGSAGAFLNDPTLYQAVEDIVGALDRSRATKWYIRKKRKEGERERLKRDQATAQEEEPRKKQAPPQEKENPTQDAASVEVPLSPPVADVAPAPSASARPSAPAAAEPSPARDPFVEPPRPKRGK